MLTDTAQNYEAEKQSDSNFCISLILNPIEVFFAAMEISWSLLQHIWRFNIFLRSTKSRKTATNRNCTDWQRAENSDEGKPLTLVQTATITATPMN